MLIIGLTGGIASGKSTVSNELKNTRGLTVVDADLIARQVVEPGRPAYRKLIAAFADVDDLTLANGELNRPALGKAVFGHPERLKVLNGITHPAVRREIFKQIVSAYLRVNQMVVLDVPLLFEAGLDKVCGVTISVSTASDTQISRLLARNPELSREDAEKRISSQMSSEVRNGRADIVLDNNGSVEDLKASVAAVVARVRPSWWWTLVTWTPVGIVWGALYQSWRLFVGGKKKVE
ncbi:dephospho-CoA kinase Cab5p [Diutina catenulata]